MISWWAIRGRIEGGMKGSGRFSGWMVGPLRVVCRVVEAVICHV